MRLIFLISLIATFNSTFAQDPELFANTWYLQNVIINGNDNIPPSNSEVPFVTVAFDVPGFETAVCDVLSGDISYNGTSEFSLLNTGMTIAGCKMQVNTDFQILYLDTFYVNNMFDPFTYTIVTEGNGSKTLTITDTSGDEAIYGNELLSSYDFANSLFVIYPNPVKDKLFISALSGLNNIKIAIFNIEGKSIILESQTMTDIKSINVEKLTKGIYFILLEDGQGGTTVKKFIKK